MDALNKAIEINPNYQIAYYNLGNSYYALGDVDSAENLYKKAIEVDPQYTDSYFNLAYLCLQRGDKEEAIMLFKKCIHINPEDEQSKTIVEILSKLPSQ